MSAQLNRLIALMALCGLLTRPVIAGAEDSQTLVVDGDTLTMHILAEPSADLGSKSLLVAASDDSLSVQTEAGRRIAKKVAAGTFASVAFAAIIANELIERWEPTSDDPHAGVAAVLLGMYYGTIFGFPIGVSLVDSHASFARTLLVGYLGAIPGIAILKLDADSQGFGQFALLVGPIISSLYASEKWRKPPQDHRVFFSLAPTPKDGFSVLATLRF